MTTPEATPALPSTHEALPLPAASSATTAGVAARAGGGLGSSSLEALISPQLRAELRAAGVAEGGGILDEPDSDLDCGPEATDVEDEA